MPTGYRPELHNFEYIAEVAWPQGTELQLDWVKSMTTLTEWLEQYVGPHYSHWAWHTNQTSVYASTVAFRWARDRTLFVLRWA
jgi:hypothetical protein